MKIGTITFHWATNYGAVLQSYALQKFLKNCNHETYIIDYFPYTYQKPLWKRFITKNPVNIILGIVEFLKEKKFQKFRSSHMKFSARYNSITELQQNPPNYDVYICGSDQIWNPNFTLDGEKKVTLSYFLDFGSKSVKRISYAASLGCTKYPENLVDKITPSLHSFDGLSVRENSGRTILEKFGLNDISIVVDPTLLLKSQDYENLIGNKKLNSEKTIFFYVLHSNQKSIKETKKYIGNILGLKIIDSSYIKHSFMSIEDWLKHIKQSEIVVTNSFHGMVFSIIFKKPFIVLPVEGTRSGMNDRIHTLLSKLGLENRLLTSYNTVEIDKILNDFINWEVIDLKIAKLRLEAVTFLNKHLY